jgi:uncharacterized protein (TIGR00730 family)
MALLSAWRSHPPPASATLSGEAARDEKRCQISGRCAFIAAPPERSAVAGAYRAAASELGKSLAAAGIDLVFGGGRVGLMGLLADAALAAGGRVTGVIPERLCDAEVAHRGVTELLVVTTMHERKRLMAERADAFAILPGGIGTLDEMFEVLSWRQLKLHEKPIFLVDIGGYWSPLRKLLGHIVEQGFARPAALGTVHAVAGVPALLAALTRLPATAPLDTEVL